MRKPRITLVLLLLLTSSVLHGQKIGLVLEGGGALGLAHIGVLQWLYEHHVPVDLVAGTSMGGLVGGFYATGRNPQEIQELIEHINWDKALSGELKFDDLSYRRKQDESATPHPAGVRPAPRHPTAQRIRCRAAASSSSTT